MMKFYLFYFFYKTNFEEEQKNEREESSKPTPKDKRNYSRRIENYFLYKYKSGKTKCARFEKRNVQKSGKTKRSKNFAHTTL